MYESKLAMILFNRAKFKRSLVLYLWLTINLSMLTRRHGQYPERASPFSRGIRLLQLQPPHHSLPPLGIFQPHDGHVLLCASLIADCSSL